MKGFIEVKEDMFDDTIEHLHRLKAIACKLIKKLSEDSDLYKSESRDDEDYESEWNLRKRAAHPMRYRY